VLSEISGNVLMAIHPGLDVKVCSESQTPIKTCFGLLTFQVMEQVACIFKAKIARKRQALSRLPSGMFISFYLCTSSSIVVSLNSSTPSTR
jgi:hypothetical protein